VTRHRLVWALIASVLASAVCIVVGLAWQSAAAWLCEPVSNMGLIPLEVFLFVVIMTAHVERERRP
jgi:hypothetical protein